MKCVFHSNSFNNVDVLLGTFSATIAMVAGMTIWMVSYSVLSNYIGITTISFGMQLLLCLVPIYNMCTGYVIIAAFESRGNFPFNLYYLKNQIYHSVRTVSNKLKRPGQINLFVLCTT